MNDVTSNRLTREIPIASGQDEVYTYDDLHRLTTSARGSLSSGEIVTPNADEQWILDTLGNWDEYLERTAGVPSLHQDREHNKVNEISRMDATFPTDPSVEWLSCQCSSDTAFVF